MQNIKNIIFLAVSVFVLPCSGSDEIIGEIASATFTTTESIMIAGVVVHTYPIVKDIYQYWLPTEEQQANAVIGTERLALVKTRASFKKCLFACKQSEPKGLFTAPKKCEELARTLVECGGKTDLVSLIRDYDDIGKEIGKQI